MLCQAVFNKLNLDPITDELKKLQNRKNFIFQENNIFKKITLMHRKEEIAKIKGSICNVPIEAATICNILPRPADSNG